jgi:CAAX protease family protein
MSTHPVHATAPPLWAHPEDVDPSAAFVASARRGVLAYLVLVIALSAVIEGAIIVTHEMPLIALLMFMPALASVVVRLARGEGFADVSFRFGGRRTWVAILLALLLPFAVGFVAYGLAWNAGLATFAPPGTLRLLGAAPGLGPGMRFARLIAAVLAIALVQSFVLSIGEEVGWRGYLVLRLLDARVPHAILVSGVIWGLWHLPLIVTGLYAAGPKPLLSAAIFMVSVVSFAFPAAWARLATGSIWPAVMLHGAWNAVIQQAFDRSTTGPNALLWTGESGLLTAATLAVLALLVSRKHWPVLRTPPRPIAASVSLSLPDPF